MGLFSSGDDVELRKYKADTRDAEKGLAKLAKAEKKRGDAAVDASKRANEGADAQVAKLLKLGVGVAAVAAGYNKAKESVVAYQQEVQLRHAAAGVDMAGLRKATQGLVSDLDLLKFSAAAMNSDFKITQKELQEVAKGTILLRNAGNDLDEVLNEVTKSLVEGNVEGLKKFGIAITGATAGADAHGKIIRRLTNDNIKFGKAAGLAGDDGKRGMVAMDNSMQALKVTMGELATSLGPVITKVARVLRIAVDGLRELRDLGVKFAAELGADSKIIKDSEGDVEQRLGKANRAVVELTEQIKKKRDIQRAALTGVSGFTGVFLRDSNVAAQTPIEDALLVALKGERDALQAKAESLRRAKVAPLQRAEELGLPSGPLGGTLIKLPKPPKPPGGGGGGPRHTDDVLGSVFSRARGIESDARARAVKDADLAAGGIRPGAGGIGVDPVGIQAGLARPDDTQIKKTDALTRANNELAKSYGGVVSASRALSVVQTGATAAFDAMITGSMSAGAAFKAATGEVIRSMANEAFARSLSALGQAALAVVVSPGKVGGFLAAAALNASQAAALGLLANKMIGGGSSKPAGGGGGAGAGAIGRGGGGSRPTRNTTIVIGDDFADESPQVRRRRLKTALDRAGREDGGREGPVIFN